MVTNRQILARWKKLAGVHSPEPWTDEDDLIGFFEHFRPAGKGLDAIFEGIESGEEILTRIKEVFKATSKSSGDAPYFTPTPAKRPTESAVVRLVGQHWKKLGEIAQAAGDDEMVKLFAKMPRVNFVRGELPDSDEDEVEEHIRDLVIDFKSGLRARRSPALLLGESLYSVAGTYAIPDYVLWPLYRASSKVIEPFKPAFELWKQGVEWAFAGGNRIIASIAPLVDERPAPPTGVGKAALPSAVAARGKAFPDAKARDWLRSSTDYGDDDFYLSKIEKGLKEKSLDLLYVAKFLAGLGRPISSRGLVQILEKDAAGWNGVHTAWKYLSWQYRAETALVDAGMTAKGKLPKGSVGVHLDKAALCLMGAIALRQDKFADWCGQRLIRNFTRGDPLLNERNWNQTPFEPFAVRLYAKWRGREAELVHAATDDLLGAFARQDKTYHPLLESWHAASFAKCWLAVCDSFCNAVGTRFHPIPFCVFPAELLATARIRLDLGFDDPARAHSLFKSPIAQVPLKLSPPKTDDLFDRVVSTCAKAYPKLPLAWQW